jgi:hypothetical protein
MRVYLATVIVIVLAAASDAAIKEIDAKGRYHLGDNDSKIDGHRLALLEAKRNALEKAGTYVQSITEVKDYQLTRDEIRTYSAGIVQIEETREPEWVMVGRNLEVTVYVKARVDDQDVARKIGALREDQDATRELTDARKKVVDNERKIAALNKQLKKAKKGSASAQKVQAQRSQAIETAESSTLEAQAAVAKKFSIEAYEVTKAYVQRQIPAVKGCYRSAIGQTADRGDPVVALLGTPPIVLLLSRPRPRASRRPRATASRAEGWPIARRRPTGAPQPLHRRNDP